MARYSIYAILAAGALLAAPLGLAAVVDGQVVDDTDAPITGALITLSRADGLYAETVYSDNAGNFRLETELAVAGARQPRRRGSADRARPRTALCGRNADS